MRIQGPVPAGGSLAGGGTSKLQMVVGSGTGSAGAGVCARPSAAASTTARQTTNNRIGRRETQGRCPAARIRGGPHPDSPSGRRPSHDSIGC